MSEILFLVLLSAPLISCMNIRPPEIYGFSPGNRAGILSAGGAGLDDSDRTSRRAPFPIIAVAPSKGEGAGSASKTKMRGGSPSFSLRRRDLGPSLFTPPPHVYNSVGGKDDCWRLI